jgi:hypothetical protein
MNMAIFIDAADTTMMALDASLFLHAKCVKSIMIAAAKAATGSGMALNARYMNENPAETNPREELK